MFFYLNQNEIAIARPLLHPIIFLNNILWTSFQIIKFSSILWYSDVTGYPWVFSDWSQSLYFIPPFKNVQFPKHCLALHILLKTLWAVEERVILLIIQLTPSHILLDTSVLSIIWLSCSPFPQLSKTPLVLPVHSLVYVTQQNNN